MNTALIEVLARWSRIITDPDWYVTIWPQYQKLEEQYRDAPANEKANIKEQLYGFFEVHLKDQSICVGSSGPDWDTERKPIDTVVMHHSSLPSGITHDRLSAIHLLRLYASYYANPAASEADITGQCIYSGHFANGKPVFYAYHWLIREDGTAEQLLADNEVGWHAGNWEINCRSIGICFDADLTNVAPTPEALAAAKQVIQNYEIAPERVLAHREVNTKTSCPGDLYDEWKSALVS